jgi:hypothetical protein
LDECADANLKQIRMRGLIDSLRHEVLLMASTTSARSSWTRWLLQRWPTTLAVALVAFILSAPEAERTSRRLSRSCPWST